MEFRIDELLDGFEDQSVQIQTVEYTSADRIKELTMKKIKQDYAEGNSRRGARKLFTVMLAAVLVFALTAGAFAAFSIHQKRQQQLREDLKIDENNVTSYVEYIDPQETIAEGIVTELPATTEEKQELDQMSVKLLSAIRDDELQRVYVNLAPISKEEAMDAISKETIFFSIDGGKSVAPVQFSYDTSKYPNASSGQTHNLMMDYSYDEQTKTLMFACNILVEELPKSGSITLDILRIEDFYIQYSYGSVNFEPTALEMRQIMFDEPVELHNDSLQESCYVVGVQLYPTGATYMVELNNGERLFSPVTLTEEEQDALTSWIDCIDPLLRGAVLILEDGSEFKTGTIMGCPYENGYVMHKTWWDATINIHEVTAVRIASEARICSSFKPGNVKTDYEVTLLSAIRDDMFQQVYLNISPVTKKEALEATSKDCFGYSLGNTNQGGFANVPFDQSLLTKDDMILVHDEELGIEYETLDPEKVQALQMAYSYDEESQTLTLMCSIAETRLTENEPVVLNILKLSDENGVEGIIGSVSFVPTELEMCEILFDEPIELYNDVLKESCRVVGVQLHPTSAAWMVELNHAETLFRDGTLTQEEQNALMSWLDCTDVPLSEAVLVFEDGSEFSTGAILTSPYENGRVMHRASWQTTINIHDVSFVRISNEVRNCK